MTSRLNIAKELQSPEIRRFVEQVSRERGRDMRFSEIPLKNFVDVDAKLLETKVSTLFMQGATDAAGFWPKLINVVQMKAPKDEVPIISQRDFKVHTGKVPRAGVAQSGGKVRKCELDTTNDEKIRYVMLQIDEQDVKLRNFDVIENSIMAAGGALSKHILGQITKHYVDKAANTQALGGDKRFVAVLKAMGLLGDDGFGCTAIVVEQGTDFVKMITEETTGGTMPWLSNVALGSLPLGDNFAKGMASAGVAGYLFGQIPVYVVNNDANLKGEILCVDVPSAAAFGFAPGGQIELSQEVKRMADLIENKIQTRYDYNNPDDDGSGKTNAVAAVTGASA
jgi:hypothetical protein